MGKNQRYIQLFAEVPGWEGRGWEFKSGPEDPWFYYENEPPLIPILRGMGPAYDLPALPEPRGLPADVSPLVHRKFTLPAPGDSNRLANPDYSEPSWLDFDVLNNYPWDTKVTQTVFVDPDGYRAFKETGVPHVHYGGVRGAEVIELSNKQMARRVRYNDWKATQKEAAKLRNRTRKLRKSISDSLGAMDDLSGLVSKEDIDSSVDLNPDYYTKITFSQSLRDKCPKFLEALLYIQVLGKARAIYWFSK